jgi:hypothetical protein
MGVAAVEKLGGELGGLIASWPTTVIPTMMAIRCLAPHSASAAPSSHLVLYPHRLHFDAISRYIQSQRSLVNEVSVGP